MAFVRAQLTPSIERAQEGLASIAVNYVVCVSLRVKISAGHAKRAIVLLMMMSVPCNMSVATRIH